MNSVKFMRKHGNIFIGPGSLDKVPNILKNYNNTLLLLSNSSSKNISVSKIKEAVSDIMIKDSGEPTDRYIDNFAKSISFKPDLIIAIGGGSLIDFAKVIAVLLNNPNKSTKQVYGIVDRKQAVDIIAVPTTAGTGTEVTGVSVVIDSDTRLKFGILGDDIVPKYAILDPELTLTLRERFTVSTGVDALTHAMEAFCSKKSFYMTDLYAAEAIRIIWKTLPVLKDDLQNLQLRNKMLYASMLAGLAFGTAGTGAVHGFAHIVGGKYNISHGEANSIFLAPIMWYNFNYNKDKISSLFKSLGFNLVNSDDFKRTILDFLKRIKAPTSFRDLKINKPDWKDILELLPYQKRLFEKNDHIFTEDDVKKIIDSL